MGSEVEFEAAMTALGDLAEHRWVEPYINERERDIDFGSIEGDDAFCLFSATQREVIMLAAGLFMNRPIFDLMAIMDKADAKTWTRCIEAICTRRGVESDIPAGQWLASVGG